MPLDNLEQRVSAIEGRNRRVELDKAWEQSGVRKLIVALLTYAVVTVYLYAIRIPHPFLNAIVPSLGFYLSTLALNAAKVWWIKRH